MHSIPFTDRRTMCLQVLLNDTMFVGRSNAHKHGVKVESAENEMDIFFIALQKKYVNFQRNVLHLKDVI